MSFFKFLSDARIFCAKTPKTLKIEKKPFEQKTVANAGVLQNNIKKIYGDQWFI